MYILISTSTIIQFVQNYTINRGDYIRPSTIGNTKGSLWRVYAEVWHKVRHLNKKERFVTTIKDQKRKAFGRQSMTQDMQAALHCTAQDGLLPIPLLLHS
jgi:hypothetical protein